MNNGKQIAAARALLDWTQGDLAKKSGLTPQTIIKIEKNEVHPNTATLRKLNSALSREGIVFTETGIDVPKDKITKLDGDTWFLDLLDDVYETLANEGHEKELLIFAGDNRLSPPEVVDSFRKLREAGVRIREMVEDGNDFLMGPEKDYRWIPSQFFENYNTIIYGDKVCNDFGGRGLLINNKEWASSERNKFNIMWHLLPELEVESTSNVRY